MSDAPRAVPAALHDLAGSTVGVLGYGAFGGGAGMVRFLTSVGASVVVTEVRPRSAYDPGLLAALNAPGVVAHFGGNDPSHLDGVDLLVRSPGVPAGNPMLTEAHRRGIPVDMEMSMFLRWWPGPIVGVTGTKGKSTTTTLVHTLLEVDRPALKAGNLRVNAIEALIPGRCEPGTTAVLELSSFQLEGPGEHGLSPGIAVVTNLDEDHLNVYDTVVEYWTAKSSIWAFQAVDDWLVLPDGDVATVGHIDADLARRGRRGARRLWFGAAPLPAGRDGAWTEGGRLRARWQGGELDLVGLDELRVRSDTAVLDLCAAVAVALASGMDPDDIRTGCLAAREVEDRREEVATVAGVTFVNDTTATAPRAATATVRAYGERPLAVIAGGTSKGSAFEAFADALAEVADHIVLLVHDRYDASRRIEELLADRGASDRVVRAGSMAAAIDTAASVLGADGGVVLLSPAAASFGMFTDEFDRGAQFRGLVRERTSP